MKRRKAIGRQAVDCTQKNLPTCDHYDNSTRTDCLAEKLREFLCLNVRYVVSRFQRKKGGFVSGFCVFKILRFSFLLLGVCVSFRQDRDKMFFRQLCFS